MHYSALESFQTSSERHLVVSANTEHAEEQSRGSHKRVMYLPPRGSLWVIGRAMSVRGRFTYRAQNGSTTYLSSYAVFRVLSENLITDRLRFLNDALEPGTPKGLRRTAGQTLTESVYERVADVLRASDGLSQAALRMPTSGAVPEMLFYLRAIVGFLPAIFDTLASIARKVFDGEYRILTDNEVTLGRREFRRTIRGCGASRFATQASELAPLIAVVWAFRNPTLHREGISGFPVHEVGFRGSQFNRLELSERQHKSLTEYCRLRGDEENRWGLDERFPHGTNVALEPFASHLVGESMEGINELCLALADDCDLPSPVYRDIDERRETARRLRWLTGLPDKSSSN